MNLQQAVLTLLLFLSEANARLGNRQTGRVGYSKESGNGRDGDSIPVVVTFEDGDEDAFEAMSTTFTTLSEEVEVHSMLKNLRMTTMRARPSAIAKMMNDPRVRSIEPDLEFHMDSTHETPSSGVTMAMGSENIPAFMKSVRGCDDPNTVKVAVIDGGLDGSHPDFGFCHNGFCEGKRFMNPSDQEWARSENGHGNHVAGIIAASALNGGYANGMVSDEKICVAIGRVFNDEGKGATLSAVVESLDWAIERGAHIVNMSFGISVDLDALHEAIVRLRNAGVLAVASAGNAGKEQPNYPAYYEETLAVAAVDDSKEWASFSTYNDRVDLAAPGVGIISTLPGNAVGAMDGTSMSTPFVAGAAALMKRDCMECSDQEIWRCLIDTVEPLSCPRLKCGAGLLQAGAAYNCLKQSTCCRNSDLTEEEEDDEDEDETSIVGRAGPPPTCKERKERCLHGRECCSGRCNRNGRCRGN